MLVVHVLSEHIYCFFYFNSSRAKTAYMRSEKVRPSLLKSPMCGRVYVNHVPGLWDKFGLYISLI